MFTYISQYFLQNIGTFQQSRTLSRGFKPADLKIYFSNTGPYIYSFILSIHYSLCFTNIVTISRLIYFLQFNICLELNMVWFEGNCFLSSIECTQMEIRILGISERGFARWLQEYLNVILCKPYGLEWKMSRHLTTFKTQTGLQYFLHELA